MSTWKEKRKIGKALPTGFLTQTDKRITVGILDKELEKRTFKFTMEIVHCSFEGKKLPICN